MTVSSEEASASNLTVNAKRALAVCIALSLATALAIISPFFWMGNASGHDFSFHVASWMDAAAQWREGILFPRWTDRSESRIRRATIYFLSPNFLDVRGRAWISRAVDFRAGSVHRFDADPRGIVRLCAGAAFISAAWRAGRARFVMRRIPTRYSSCTCAAILRSNSHWLFSRYCFWRPWKYQACCDSPARSARRSIVFLAITFAAVWLTNAPAGVVASYSLAMLLVWTAVTQKIVAPIVARRRGASIGFWLSRLFIWCPQRTNKAG